MGYLFRGNLCGLICPECSEPLADVKVRLYRNRAGQAVTALAVAPPKETFAILTENEVQAKAAALFAETTTDEKGNFTFELAEGYDGEAFEVDVVCGTVPRLRLPPVPPRPLQFSVTTLQPRWRQVENNFVAAWDYCLPQRFWCGIRGRFGAWTICGRVLFCTTNAPFPGARVRAFDTDWLQHDPLGDAITDDSGHFRIDYSREAFEKTVFSPLIQGEMTVGPDLYFRVETLLGAPLLVERPSRGREPDRENVGPCFCVDLCIPKEGPPIDVTDEPLPHFNALGRFLYASEIDSMVPGSGLTVGDDRRAFYSTVPLNGVLPRTLSRQPMEYRFEFRVTDANGNPTGVWTPIGPEQFTRTRLGVRQRLIPSGIPPIVDEEVFADPANPGGGPLNARIVDGWIKVPQWTNLLGPEGFFAPEGNLLNIDTTKLVRSPDIDVTGVTAGESSTALGAPFASNKHIALRMVVRQVGDTGPGTEAGECHHVAIENTRYQGVAKGGSWSPTQVDGQMAVVSVDALQLRGNGCAGIDAGLDVLLTATHPNLGQVTLEMTGPGRPITNPYRFTLPAATGDERFGTAVADGWDIAALEKCAYIIKLRADLLLTTGDFEPGPIEDQIGFCK